jgi:hypothetical protein
MKIRQEQDSVILYGYSADSYEALTDYTQLMWILKQCLSPDQTFLTPTLHFPMKCITTISRCTQNDKIPKIPKVTLEIYTIYQLL